MATTSKVYKNTEYGPVSQQEAAGSTAVDSQTQGSLTQVVLQPGDVTFSGSWWNGKYTEVWKGPFATIKDWPATKFKVGLQRNGVVASLGTMAVVRFSPPSAGYDQWGVKQSWVIDSCQCQQLAAGDHGLLRVSYVASSGYSWSGLAQEDKSSETWQLDWQPYSIRPYAFCKNDEIQDQLAKDYKEDKSKTAWRKNIEDFFKSQAGNKKEWEYQNATGSALLKLNYAEQKIAKKVLLDRSCVWHYPLVTHVTVSKQPVQADTLQFDKQFPDKDLGINLDTLMDGLPNGCPYTFEESDWKWMKVADNVTETRTSTETSFTRRQVYQGMKEADVNFYGKQKFSHADLDGTRWKIGEV